MSVLADMIRAADKYIDRQWGEEFGSGWEAKEQIEDTPDSSLKRELAKLELEHRRVCLEQDIAALKGELAWRVEKRLYDKEVAEAEAAMEAAKKVVNLNGSGRPQ
jgi:hypothetical protein